ncbi:MAG: preprotein translocase subunit SecE [Clostridia bacterium]|nr:preprotein translocase subunit SecE [Clostridia bacterium]MBP5236596.1 preprotein translocase subunit SecE [Clostridia bacterium]
MAEKKKEVEKTTAEKPAKKSKPGLFKRIAKFFRDYKSELKKIVWANPKQTLYRSIFVVVVVIVFGAVIGLLDYTFSQAINALAGLF